MRKKEKSYRILQKSCCEAIRSSLNRELSIETNHMQFLERNVKCSQINGYCQY